MTKTQLFTREESGSFHPHPSPSPGTVVTPEPCRRRGAVGCSHGFPLGLHVSLHATGEPVRMLCSLVSHSTKLCCASLQLLTEATIPKVTPSWTKLCFSELECSWSKAELCSCCLQPASTSPSSWQEEVWTPIAPPVPRIAGSAQNYSHSSTPLSQVSSLLSRVPAAHPGCWHRGDITVGCKDMHP